MVEIDDVSAKISFQWVLGDTRALEKSLIGYLRAGFYYPIMVLSRIVGIALTFAVAGFLLPSADLMSIFYISLAGSFSIYVSFGFVIMASRTLERLTASDNRNVGWNVVWLDKDGVTWNTDISQDYTSWLGVSDVIYRDNSIWIKCGPAQGYFIPSRVFVNEAQYGACVDLIEAHRADPAIPRHVSETVSEAVMH